MNQTCQKVVKQSSKLFVFYRGSTFCSYLLIVLFCYV